MCQRQLFTPTLCSKYQKLLPASHYHFAPFLCLIKYDDITLLLRSHSNPQTPTKTAAAYLSFAHLHWLIIWLSLD